MKNIKLKDGFLVDGWDGVITKCTYTKIKHTYYNEVQDRFIVIIKGVLQELLTTWSDDKVFDTIGEAEKHSIDVKRKRLSYYEKQAGEYQEKIEEYKKELK